MSSAILVEQDLPFYDPTIAEPAVAAPNGFAHRGAMLHLSWLTMVEANTDASMYFWPTFIGLEPLQTRMGSRMRKPHCSLRNINQPMFNAEQQPNQPRLLAETDFADD